MRGQSISPRLPEGHIHRDQPMVAAIARRAVHHLRAVVVSAKLGCHFLRGACVSLPVMGFTDVGFMEHSPVADHYQHVALISIAVVAAGWGTWQQRARGSARWIPNVVAMPEAHRTADVAAQRLLC
jgi:hypothetical protein